MFSLCVAKLINLTTAATRKSRFIPPTRHEMRKLNMRNGGQAFDGLFRMLGDFSKIQGFGLENSWSSGRPRVLITRPVEEETVSLLCMYNNKRRRRGLLGKFIFNRIAVDQPQVENPQRKSSRIARERHTTTMWVENSLSFSRRCCYW